MVVVNNAAPAQDTGGTSFLLGVILLIAFVVFLIMYGLPAIRSSVSTPQINVPKEVDVNVNQPK